MARTFVIGDIHGALKALEQVIARIGLQKEDRLIFLGDYVDGWSQSSLVIRYLEELEQQYSCLFLRGNHDTWCEKWLTGGTPEAEWLLHGGQATVDSYVTIGQAERDVHFRFLNRMLPYLIEDHRLFIHGGFSSMRGPAKEHWTGNFSQDRSLWELALAVDPRIPKDSKRYPKRLLLFDEIYIGHTPTTNFDVGTPMNACNVWNIDTGAAFYGKISILDIHTKEFWQSDTVQDLYPDENGRNK